MDDRRPMRTSDLFRIPRVGAPSASADGEVVVVPVVTYDGDDAVTRLWRVGGPGEDGPRALTRSDTSSTGPQVAPDGSAVAFLRRVEDRPQLFVLPLDGGEARRVTDLPMGVTGTCRWVDADHVLVVTRLLSTEPTIDATAAWCEEPEATERVWATERRVHRVWDTWYTQPLTQHVLLVDLRDRDAEPRDLTPGDWLLPDPLADPAGHLDVSPDGRLLAFTTGAPDGDADGVVVPHLHVVPVDGGEVVDLTPAAPGPVGPPRFLPDGRVLVAIQRERDFYAAPVDLWAIDPADTSREPVLTDAGDGLGQVAVGPDGRTVLGTDRRGRGVLLEVADGTTHPLPVPTTGSLGAPVVTARGVVAQHSAALAPPEVVLVTDDGVEQLTSFTTPVVDELDLGTLEERTVVGGDGDQVQAWVLHPPATATAEHDGGPLPMVHLLHGGPHGAWLDSWHWRWCAARFAAEGAVAVMVNFHGSTGFGHDWTSSIHGDWATLPTADVLAVTDALVEDGTADPERLVLTGGSYGGYLTTWLCTRTDRFATAVAHAAVTDFGGMWATDWTSAFAGAFGGRLWQDPAATYRHSPSWHYGRMSTPMLVVHGERDLRVPIDQGRALFGVLQDMRIESRLVVFPDEHHWVLSRTGARRWYDEVLGWVERFVGRVSTADR